MLNNPLYRNGLGLAVLLHLLLGGALVSERNVSKPMAVEKGPNILSIDVKNTTSVADKTVAAVSVNENDLKQAVAALKQEKKLQQQAELDRQNKLQLKAQQATQLRQREEMKLQQLKKEMQRKQLAQKQRVLKEAKKLNELKRQKAAEEKRLVEVKKKQREIEKSQKIAENLRIQKAKEAQAMEEQKQQAAARARKAQMMSEAEKFKVLIVTAISKQWILPENVDDSLSSQFHIRLAPDGTVLDVQLAQSSGDSILDRSAQTAIYKASPLPVPADTQLFEMFRSIRLTVRPENVRG